MKIKEYIMHLLGVKCWHKWIEVKRNDWLIDERCKKCGKTALRQNF